MRFKTLIVLSSACLLASAVTLAGSSGSALHESHGQPGWLASLQFKGLTLAAALP
jgi:hypothetical protein